MFFTHILFWHLIQHIKFFKILYFSLTPFRFLLRKYQKITMVTVILLVRNSTLVENLSSVFLMFSLENPLFQFFNFFWSWFFYQLSSLRSYDIKSQISFVFANTTAFWTTIFRDKLTLWYIKLIIYM